MSAPKNGVTPRARDQFQITARCQRDPPGDVQSGAAAVAMGREAGPERLCGADDLNREAGSAIADVN